MAKRQAYSLVIETTKDPKFFGVRCPELEKYGACTCTGTSPADAVKNGRRAIKDFIEMLAVDGIELPQPNCVDIIFQEK